MNRNEQLGLLCGDVQEPQAVIPGLPGKLVVVWHCMHVTIPQPCKLAKPFTMLQACDIVTFVTMLTFLHD